MRNNIKMELKVTEWQRGMCSSGLGYKQAVGFYQKENKDLAFIKLQKFIN